MANNCLLVSLCYTTVESIQPLAVWEGKANARVNTAIRSMNFREDRRIYPFLDRNSIDRQVHWLDTNLPLESDKDHK